MKSDLITQSPAPQLPPILAGRFTPDVHKRVEQFYFSVASCFESWVARRTSPHTQRAYRADVMSFVRFSVRCPVCGRRLHSIASLKLHMTTDHQRSRQCPNCGKQLRPNEYHRC